MCLFSALDACPIDTHVSHSLAAFSACYRAHHFSDASVKTLFKCAILLGLGAGLTQLIELVGREQRNLCTCFCQDIKIIEDSALVKDFSETQQCWQPH